MAVLPWTCQDCGGAVDRHLSQAVSDGKLWWHAEYGCPQCGTRLVACDTGIPPEGVRKAILGDQGVWQLTVSESGSGRLVALKALRAALSLSLAEVAELRARLPRVVLLGTYAEMLWLHTLLSPLGLQSAVEMVDNTDMSFLSVRDLHRYLPVEQ